MIKNNDPNSFIINQTSRYWPIVLVSITIPLVLNVIAFVLTELKYQVISNYNYSYIPFGYRPFDPWPEIILQVMVVLSILAYIGWIAVLLLKLNLLRNKINLLRFILSVVIFGIYASINSFGTLFIDFIWSSAFQTGPTTTIGIPNSSYSKTNTILSFSITISIFIIYYVCYEIKKQRDGQPNPRST